MSHDNDETLKKIEKTANHENGFSDEEIRIVRDMIRAYRGVRAFGWASKLIISVLASIAGGFIAWKTVTSEVKKWFIGG